ncbi:MAG: hypothetical protein ACKPKO_59980, partial [Candidatus Fonsibacter sp.]
WLGWLGWLRWLRWLWWLWWLWWFHHFWLRWSTSFFFGGSSVDSSVMYIITIDFLKKYLKISLKKMNKIKF